MRIRGRLAGAAAVVCIAGCGSGPAAGPAPSSAQTLAAVLSAARGTLAGSSAFSVRLDAAPVPGETSKPIIGSGVFDFETNRGRVEIDQPTGVERAIFLPASVLAAEPDPAAGLPAGKIWISAGLTQPSVSADAPQFVTRLESLNPALVLAELQWGAQSAAPIAAAPHLHGYSVKVDLVKAQARVAGSAAATLRRAIGYQLAEMSGTAVPTELMVDVAIDRQGRVVMLRSSPPGAGTGFVSVSLSHFGAPVTITPPAAVQVADISSITPTGEGDPDGRS